MYRLRQHCADCRRFAVRSNNGRSADRRTSDPLVRPRFANGDDPFRSIDSLRTQLGTLASGSVAGISRDRRCVTRSLASANSRVALFSRCVLSVSTRCLRVFSRRHDGLMQSPFVSGVVAKRRRRSQIPAQGNAPGSRRPCHETPKAFAKFQPRATPWDRGGLVTKRRRRLQNSSPGQRPGIAVSLSRKLSKKSV